MNIAGITFVELQNNSDLTYRILAKLFANENWDHDDFTHAEYQWLIDNGKVLTGANLFSPELTESQMNSDVPDTWQDSAITDAEGAYVRQKTWFEYCTYITTANGYCVQFAGGAKGANGEWKLPNNTQLRAWVIQAGGFLTRNEALALRVTE